MQGILRGFDPFMNLVVDDSLEMGPGGQQNSIGMVVSTLAVFFLLSVNSIKRAWLSEITPHLLCSALYVPSIIVFDDPMSLRSKVVPSHTHTVE